VCASRALTNNPFNTPLTGPEEKLEIESDLQNIKDQKELLKGRLGELTAFKLRVTNMLAWFYGDDSTYTIESGSATIGAVEIAGTCMRRFLELSVDHSLVHMELQLSTSSDLPSGALALVRVHSTLAVEGDLPRRVLDVFEVDKTVPHFTTGTEPLLLGLVYRPIRNKIVSNALPLIHSLSLLLLPLPVSPPNSPSKPPPCRYVYTSGSRTPKRPPAS